MSSTTISPPTTTTTTTPSPLPLITRALPHTFHPPRHFNSLTLSSIPPYHVYKTSSNPAILGELHFYTNLPADLVHLFPTCHAYHYHHQNSITLTLSLLRGPTASSLLTASLFTSQHLDAILTSLHTIHSSAGPPAECANATRRAMYRNYACKVLQRWVAHRQLYEAIGLDDTHFERLLRLLRDYERRDAGVFACVIHGDAVLTNAVITASGVGWVDPRGMLGGELRVGGDRVYDYAKVVQSLVGYDWIVCGGGWEAGEEVVVEWLVRRVRRVVEGVGVKWRDLVVVVCSLVTSLVPLHEGKRGKRFAAIAKVLLKYGESGGEGVVGMMREVMRL